MRKYVTRFLTLFFFVLFYFNGLLLTAQSYQWKSLPMGGAGFVTGIITSKQERNLMYCRTDVGGAYKWNATTSSWVPLLDWVSESQTGFMGVESMAIDPHATNKLYLYVGTSYFNSGKTAILKSDDYGATFTTIDVTSQFKAHGNGMGRSTGERLQVDPNLGSVLYVGTRANGLWKSTNSGTSWSRLAGLDVTNTPNGNGVSFVLIDSTTGSNGIASSTIYVGISRFATTGDNLYKSTDGGVTFNPIMAGPAAFMPQRAVLTSAGDLIVAYANGSGPYGTTSEPMNNGGIWKYNKTSGNWTNSTPAGVAKAFGGLSVDPVNPNKLVASTINNYQFQYGSAYGDRIYLSTDGGTTWTDVVARGFSIDANGANWILTHAIHWAGCIEFDPFNSKKVWVVSGNGIFSNADIDAASTQWKFDVKGLEETVPRDIASITGGPLLSAISDYDGFIHTDITQYAPIHSPRMGTTTGIAFAAANPNKLLRVGGDATNGGRLYYSINQGASWIQCTSANGYQGKVALSADGNVFYHGAVSSNTLYRSIDNGTTWNSSTNLNMQEPVPVADMVNASKVYAYNPSNGNMFVSTDAGASFSTGGSVGTGGSKIIRAVPGKEGHLWVAMYGGGLKRSTNSGASFTAIGGVTYCGAIGLGKAINATAYHTLYMWGTVNGVLGVHRSTDEGATWVRVNDDAHQFGGPGNGQFVVGDMNMYGTVYMSTVGRGVIVGTTGSITTSVSTPWLTNDFIFSVIPNPVTLGAAITTQCTSAKTMKVMMQTISVSGAILHTRHVTIPVGKTQLTLTGLKGKPAGLYFLTVVDEKTKRSLHTAKILIQ